MTTPKLLQEKTSCPTMKMGKTHMKIMYNQEASEAHYKFKFFVPSLCSDNQEEIFVVTDLNQFIPGLSQGVLRDLTLEIRLLSQMHSKSVDLTLHSCFHHMVSVSEVNP